MKIESSTKPASAPLAKDVRNPAAGKAAASSEQVHLSGLASQLRASDDEHSFDAARVSEIKKAIAEGRFSINAEAIADRLITSAKELINSQRQA